MQVIDDFTSPARATIGTRWRFFTDGVMGGVSSGEARIGHLDGRPCLGLAGQVRTENRGGFIQAALDLDPDGRPVAAARHAGLRFAARGNGRVYYIHLRTADTRAPWQLYAAPFETIDRWRDVLLPWSAFQPSALDAPLDPARLTRVALVAAKAAFRAEVAIAALAFA
ncbi:MAG: CIA30 family protein [Gemmatimonadales bacterium]|nr:CIA30 family protein [Gemmatimonadales bacterium]